MHYVCHMYANMFYPDVFMNSSACLWILCSPPLLPQINLFQIGWACFGVLWPLQIWDSLVVFDQIKVFQLQAIVEENVRTKKKKQKGMQKEDPSKVSFSCRSCNRPVCSGEHIKVIEDMHHVVVTPGFRYQHHIFADSSRVHRMFSIFSFCN